MMFTVETRYKRIGNVWHGTAKITGPNGVKTISLSYPIPAGASARVSGHHDLVGFSFSDIGKAVSSITKSKLVKKLGKVVKDVVKSDITKGIVAAAAVAFPPVGVPAAAALATALTVTELAEKADRYVGTAKTLAKSTGKALSGPQKANLNLAMTGSVRGGPKIDAKTAVAQLKAGMQAKRLIADTVKRSIQGDPRAMQFAKTLVVAKRARRKLNAIRSHVSKTRHSPGILVLPSGEMLRGAFNAAAARRV